jgi:hypothetical protein
MTASYDASLPSDRDWVRFLIGDRDTDNPIHQDEEIDALLIEERNKYMAAFRAGQVIVAQDQGIVEKAVGDLRLDRGDDSAKNAYSQYLLTLQKKGAITQVTEKKVFRLL